MIATNQSTTAITSDTCGSRMNPSSLSASEQTYPSTEPR